MLEHCRTAQERWGGVHTLIDRWLQQRHDLLVRLVTITDACEADIDALPKRRIDSLSEGLMDYVSAGHFEIYPQLREEAKSFDDPKALEVADRLLARVEASTRMALDFEADYATPDDCQHHRYHLPTWLGRLSDALSERFVLEDQLIERVHAIHAPTETRPTAERDV
ncbi:sigma D regulator [Salinicola aestuarinus]|uniref:sigma D regulator n=1 Tax=Salinicola aestuarinus TaxID=1949082 RepID=UPI000DA117A1|nr:sigma D regulator [Salinicola aestuarinus]